jgi:hypothetical protein
MVGQYNDKKRTKGKTMTYKILYRELKIEKTNLTKTGGELR